MLSLKICGLKYPENITEILLLKPEYTGFIFYEKSTRFVDQPGDVDRLSFQETKKIGVFVNATMNFIEERIKQYELDGLQLHGEENPEFCAKLRKKYPSLVLIKVFSVGNAFDFNLLEEYVSYVDFFLFDTATEKHGGSGKTFDWDVLKKYPLEKPFFLSGGLSLDNIPDALDYIQQNNLPVQALDVNSCFETAAAFKDVVKLKKLQTLLSTFNLHYAKLSS